MATRQTAAYNFTIDDASPLIRYEPANFWDDNVSQDANLPNYFQRSFHYSINPTATATLSFTGTGVWVFGARRSISGAYSVQIDNQPVQSFGPNTRNAAQFQALLGGVNGLPFGVHTIVVKNLSTDNRQQVLDIDSFVVETAAGNESDQSFSGPTVIDDANPGITYSANEWVTTSRVAPSSTPWRNGTVRESNVNGANVEFSFEGRGVSVTGVVGPRNGNFRVELDGRDMGELSARASALHPATPIWFASGLSPGPHRVKLTNTGLNGDALTIDSYQVFASTSVNAPPSGASDPASASPTASVLTPASPTPSANHDNISYSRTSSLPIGAIVGSSVGGLVLLCLIALGILYYIRLRRKNATLGSEHVRPFTQAPPGSAGAQPEVRWSSATAVEMEAGLQAAEKAERAERTEKAEKTSGWLRRSAKDKNSEPPTPPLPLQDYTPSPSALFPPGPNPILGTGGYASSNDMTGYLVPSGSTRPSPAPTPTRMRMAAPSIISAGSVSSPRPPPRTPLPPTPIIGLPPRPRQQGNFKHGRTPSVGTGLGGPSGGRSLTSQEIRRSRSAQVLREQTRMESTDDALAPPPARRFDQLQARESNQSLEFDLSAYTDQRTPTLVTGARAFPAVPSIPREYAPYASKPGSIRSSLDSERSGQRRRAGMI